jgi:F-type H+-transporting ATPase subunit b
MSVIERIMQAVQEGIETALGINLLDMIIQIAATLILVLIVKKFFWGRITDFLEKRQNIMDQEMDQAKTSNIEAEELKLKREEEYNQLRMQSKSYLDNAKQKAEAEKQRIIFDAKANAENLLDRTNKEIEAEKTKAKEELKQEVVDLAALMAEKIIGEVVDQSKYQDLLIEDLERSEKS